MTENPTIDEAELARKLGTEIRDAYRVLVVIGEDVQSLIRARLREIRLKSVVAVQSEDEHLRGRGDFWISVLANVGDLAKGVEASR
jgi:hypothetical protein